MSFRDDSDSSFLVQRRLNEKFLQAADTNNLKEITSCLEQGVDPNYFSHGTTALHLAAERGDVILGEYLLKCPNININIRTSHSNTPLILSCLFNKPKFAELLLKYGADPNAYERRKVTPMHVCCRRGHIIIIKILIKYKANVNAIDFFGNTPMAMCYFDNPNLEVAKLLLQNGADINVGSDGVQLHLFFETVLNCHTSYFINFVFLLLQNGVNVNMIDKVTQKNCLHYVALTGFIELAQFLLRWGADCNAVDNSMRTPAMVAKEHGNKEIQALLKKCEKKPQLRWAKSYEHQSSTSFTSTLE